LLQGKVRFTVHEEVELAAASMISLEKQVEHSIDALEDSLVVLELTPSPEAHSMFKP
jgi:quercetin dioxygenase-like cupin family protein